MKTMGTLQLEISGSKHSSNRSLKVSAVKVPSTLILRFRVEGQIFAFYGIMDLNEYILGIWIRSDGCFVTPDDPFPKFCRFFEIIFGEINSF